MVIEYHEDVVDDIAKINDDVLKTHLKKIVKTSFYNLSVISPKYPNLHSFTTAMKIEILFLKNQNSILIISIQQK